MSVPPFPIEAVGLFFRILATERGLRMSKQLWDYLRSRVQVVTSDGKVIKGFVTDFIDEMDNDEQLSSLTILALMNQLRFLSLRVKLSQLKQSSSA